MINHNRLQSIIFDHLDRWQPARRNSYHKCVVCDRKPAYTMKGWMVYKMRRVIAWASCPQCWEQVLKSKKVTP
jgi:hypothetical protein